jgi:hypothetical protein
VYIRERYYFSLVRTFKEAIDNIELKVDIQKGAFRFRGKFTLDVLVSSYLL